MTFLSNYLTENRTTGGTGGAAVGAVAFTARKVLGFGTCRRGRVLSGFLPLSKDAQVRFTVEFELEFEYHGNW